MNIRAKAPLRVSFAGGGTDVPPYPELYGGCVLNATIDNFAWGSLRPRTDGITRIASADLGIEVELNVARKCASTERSISRKRSSGALTV